MWQKKIWARCSSRRGDPSVAGRAARALLAAAVILLAACLPAAGARADEAIRVTAHTHSYAFSQSLTFGLEAQSGSPITEVILFYGLQGERLVRRIYPKFTPGTEVRVEHVEELESGQFAPGARILYWWRLTVGEGTTLETAPETFEYTDDNQSWRTLPGQRVDLLWYGKDEAKAKDLLARAEEAIDRLQVDIDVSLDRRVRISVYNSDRDMSAALARRSQGYDQRVTTLGVAVSEDTLLLLGPHSDVRQTVAHELSHIVVHMATRNPYTDLPRWLDEGLAMYAEGTLPGDNQDALEAGIKEDRLLSIRSMSSYSGQASQVDLFYGEAYSVVAFMLKEFGAPKMRELLAVFTEGTLQEEALRRVYGFGLAELDNRWRESLGLKPRPTPAITPASQGKTSRLGRAVAPAWAGLWPLAAGAAAGAP